jgi:hypothetical protein
MEVFDMKKKLMGIITVMFFSISIGGVSASVAEPNSPDCYLERGGNWVCKY